MERINRRGHKEYLFVSHLKLSDLKHEAKGLENKYLFNEYVPPYPRPEFHLSHLKHDTNRDGLRGICKDSGFKNPFDSSLVWWSLFVGPDEINSAERRLLKTICPNGADGQAKMQRNFLGKFATSPAFVEPSRLGSYRFIFTLEEVLLAYSEQRHCVHLTEQKEHTHAHTHTHTHSHTHSHRMAAVSPRHCGRAPTFIIALLILSGGRYSPVSCFKVLEGGVASLSCQYSVKRYGLSRVCWGRGCGTFWCNNILVQTDEHGIVSKVSDRYQLTGDILDGELDLDILNVRRTDSGPYCCRVDIDGVFNDKKVIMNLRVVKAPVKVSPPTTAGITATAPSTSTVSWRFLLSSQLDLLKKNSSSTHSNLAAMEDSLPALSLQINVPVLSLALTVVLMVAVLSLFLAFRRGPYGQALRSRCLSSGEPRHIIYEIQMRRPIQENVYTLD